MIVYLDTVFFYNMLADHLLLLAAGRLAGFPVKRSRIFLAALLGGGYAAAMFLPGGDFLADWWLKLLTAAAMVWIAFGSKGLFLRRYLLFLMVSGAFAGVELALCSFAGTECGTVPFSLPLFLVCFAFCWLVLGVVFRGTGAPAAKGQLLQVGVMHRGRMERFTALADSGCSLRDPVDGRAVLVAELAALESLLSDEEKSALISCKPLRSLDFMSLPFRSLGGSGEIAAFRADEVIVGGEAYRDALVAIHPMGFDGEMFHALWGGKESAKWI